MAAIRTLSMTSILWNPLPTPTNPPSGEGATDFGDEEDGPVTIPDPQEPVTERPPRLARK